MAELEVTIDGSGARRGARTVTRSLDDIRKKTGESERAFKKQAKSIDGVEKAMGQLKKVAGPLIAAFGAQQLLGLVNDYQTLQNSLRVVTDGTDELAMANERLFEIAQATRQPLQATASLYSRASIAAKELGASQDQLFDLVQVTGRALAVQGGSAAESAGALRQLSQSFSSGIVRAEEFNSILEGAFPLAQAAARGIEEAAGSVGKLRNMVVDGEITSKAFFEAILKGGVELEDQFANTEVTVGQALTTVQNSFLRLVGTAAEASGASQLLAESLVGVSDGLDTLGAAFSATLGPEEDVTEGMQLFISVLLVAMRTVGIFGDSLYTTLTTPFKVAGDAIGGTAAALVAFAKGEFSEAAAIMDMVSTDAVSTTVQNFSELREELVADTSGTIESLVELWDKGARDIADSLEEVATGDTAAPAVSAAAVTEPVEKIKEAFGEAMLPGDLFYDMLEEGASITQSVRTPMEEYADTVMNLQSLLQVGAITQETFNRAVEQSAEKMRDSTAASGELASFLEQTSIAAARNIQGAFADFLFDPFDQGLEGLVSGFADAMKRMAAEALSQQIISGILGAATGGAGGGAGGLLGAVAGAFTSRATGGPLVAGQGSVVNERGQEAFVPREAGQVVSNRELRQGGQASPNVNVPVEIVNITDPSAIPAAMESAQGKKAILNVIQSNPDSIKRALS